MVVVTGNQEFCMFLSFQLIRYIEKKVSVSIPMIHLFVTLVNYYRMNCLEHKSIC